MYIIVYLYYGLWMFMVEDNELVNGGYEPTNKTGGTTFSWPNKPSNEQSSISTPTKKTYKKTWEFPCLVSFCLPNGSKKVWTWVNIE